SLGGCLGPSRTTWLALLSSRRPRNTGWRSFPSRVHSANFTSQTRRGVVQRQRFMAAGVRRRSPVAVDTLENGGELPRSGARRDSSSWHDRAVKPVPTLPANFNLPSS